MLDDGGGWSAVVLIDGTAIVGAVVNSVAAAMAAAATAATAAAGLIAVILSIAGLGNVGTIAVDFVFFGRLDVLGGLGGRWWEIAIVDSWGCVGLWAVVATSASTTTSAAAAAAAWAVDVVGGATLICVWSRGGDGGELSVGVLGLVADLF
jgi:hypothetical protein